ncbi:hypothetical protein [Rothia nasimurium]|uniref:hypothetical protein n=1 Tax=Rothia nasimurium TaxID=85336 RepID=UPI001F3CB125|nr:hypothetical protein [Rothia nasimurium]
MSQLEIARRWATRANLALQEAGHQVLATLDPEEANGHLNAGAPVILIEVESATYETWTVTEYKLRFILISPHRAALEAWEQLEAITADVRDPLELETAQLSMWQPDNGRPYPCNLLTTTTTEMD